VAGDVRAALVGCGNIAERYARSIMQQDSLELAGVTDVFVERAADLANRLGVTHYGSLETLLADDRVQVVVNLTAPESHANVTAAALEAGKHVHTEKPVALRYDEARDLAALAERLGVRLSCAPASLLGEAQQTAWKLVREDGIGRVRVAYAEANWGRIETWHPSPQSLYAVGPLFDVGVYPLTILTAMFGPVRRVAAYDTKLEPERETIDGEPFVLGAPDFVAAVLELESGVVVRVTANFWVRPGRQRGVELHGETASLYLASWAEYDSALETSPDGESYTSVPLVREPYHGVEWARAVVDLADAVAEDRPHRASAEHAAHVVEVMEAVARAAAEEQPAEVHSGFEPPLPMEWAS
jgi:predicted dehydrogenase